MKEILNIIYQYYPRNLDPIDSVYFDSLETKRLITTIKSAEKRIKVWNDFFADIEKGYGRDYVSEWTQLFNMDACYKLRICILDSDTTVKEIAVHISVISEYFSVYVSTFEKSNRFAVFPQRFFLSDTNELQNFQRIKKILLKYYPNHSYLEPDIANQIVPDIAIGNHYYGQVNIFHCLFTTHIW